MGGGWLHFEEANDIWRGGEVDMPGSNEERVNDSIGGLAPD